MNTLGERIKSVREEWEWSQGELAHALCCDQASISLWEHDKIVPSGTAIVALAALFGLTCEALSDGEGFQIPDGPACIPAFFEHLPG
jgi:DNA-binding XRE family transcriptional regulator